jgi:hypothetical protein
MRRSVGPVDPAEPKISEYRMPKPEGEILQTQALAAFDTEALLEARTHYPVPLAKARYHEIYERAKNGMLEAGGATLVSEEEIVILHRDGRRYLCEFTGSTTVGEVRMVIVGDDLSMFTYIRNRDQKPPTAAAAFFARISDKEKN